MTNATATRAEEAQERRTAQYRSVAERIAIGKEARTRTPRSSHAVYDPPSGRADPIDLLERQAASRVQELVPIRYGRMLASPFTFYRGGALIMANDLATTPDSGLRVQCCGDAHLSNFGAFASPERTLVFDINDFDETLPGPWEWDVKRLAVSLLIAARNNDFRPKTQRRVVLEAVAQYRTAMAQFATMSNLDVWYAQMAIEALVAERGAEYNSQIVKRTESAIAKAHTRDSMSAFAKLTNNIDGRVEIVNEPPLIVPVEQFASAPRKAIFDELRKLISDYRESLDFDRRVLLEQFEIADFARKVVGVGSVGTRAFIGLMVGRDGQDPLFLQAKEAQPSVLEDYVGASTFSCHGERVVAGQRLMQASSDIFLGWLHVEAGFDGSSHDYYVRQLRDWKASAEVEQMTPEGMTAYGQVCGWTLARAHARSGDRIAIASYLGTSDVFDRAIVEFSDAYAAQNELDYRVLSAAVKSGRVQAEFGL